MGTAAVRTVDQQGKGTAATAGVQRYSPLETRYVARSLPWRHAESSGLAESTAGCSQPMSVGRVAGTLLSNAPRALACLRLQGRTLRVIMEVQLYPVRPTTRYPPLNARCRGRGPLRRTWCVTSSPQPRTPTRASASRPDSRSATRGVPGRAWCATTLRDTCSRARCGPAPDISRPRCRGCRPRLTPAS